jgi:hypothetical protein
MTLAADWATHETLAAPGFNALPTRSPDEFARCSSERFAHRQMARTTGRHHVWRPPINSKPGAHAARTARIGTRTLYRIADVKLTQPNQGAFHAFIPR